MTREEFARKDEALRHAIQTGIMHEMERSYLHHLDENLKRAIKHLRTGLNCAMREHSTVVKLLIEKGIITEQEYFVTHLQELENEVKILEASLQKHFGITVKLG